MPQHVLVELEIPDTLDRFALPPGVDERLQHWLSRQDQGNVLTPAERKEAEGLVDLADMLSLLKLCTQRVWNEPSQE